MKETLAILDDKGRVQKSHENTLPIYSITKTMIASITLDLGIDLEKKLAEWIPNSICRHAEKITVKNLLNHSSGLRDYGALPEYSQGVHAGQKPWNDEKFIELTIDKDLLFEPGNGFAYSNPGYWLLKRIIETESELSFDDLVERHIAKPLGLSSVRVAHGIFEESLINYDAGWVWHGLALANAVDIVRFMSSEKVSRLNSALNKVNYQDDYWKNSHYGLGLMVEPGVMYGHLGGGPGFEAACIKFLDTGICICAIVESSNGESALARVFKEKKIFLGE